MAEPVHAAQPGDRRVVDDDARALPHHYGDPAPGHKPGSLQVDVDHRVPRLFAELMGQAIGADPGVVEEEIDTPELRHGGVDGGGDCGIVAYVTFEGQAIGAGLTAEKLKAAQFVLGTELVAWVGQRLGHIERPNERAGPGEGRKGAIGDASKRLRELPAKLDDELLAIVERKLVRVLARLDQDPAEERRADEAIRIGGDRVGEEVGQALAEEGPHCVPQGVPLHERVERGQRMEQSAFHVGYAAVFTDYFVVGGAHAGRRPRIIDGTDAWHGLALLSLGGNVLAGVPEREDAPTLRIYIPSHFVMYRCSNWRFQ